MVGRPDTLTVLNAIAAVTTHLGLGGTIRPRRKGAPETMRIGASTPDDASGVSPDGKLPEIAERNDHPWFIGVQYHPELKSKPFDPHPLFVSFIEAAIKQGRLV